jgi:hypothetical protein
MNYFDDCFDIESIKRRYHRLCFQHHPDRGGNPEIMKAVNAAYHAALESKSGHSFDRSDGKGTYTYRYDYTREQAVINKIAELIRARLDGCRILLIGNWIWITGDTRPHRKTLKAAGCRWHGKRRCWYWRDAKNKHRKRGSRGSLATLAYKYGAREFGQEQKEKETAGRSMVSAG